jgi:hypothetical protein
MPDKNAERKKDPQKIEPLADPSCFVEHTADGLHPGGPVLSGFGRVSQAAAGCRQFIVVRASDRYRTLSHG